MKMLACEKRRLSPEERRDADRHPIVGGTRKKDE